MSDFENLIKQMISGNIVCLFFKEPQTNGRVEWVKEEWSYETGRKFFICAYDEEYNTRYSLDEMLTAFSWDVASNITVIYEYQCLSENNREVTIYPKYTSDITSEIACTVQEPVLKAKTDIYISDTIKEKSHLKLLKFTPRKSEPPDEINPLYESMTFSEATDDWNLGKSTLRMMVRSNRLAEGIDYRKSGSQWLITKKAMINLYGKRKKNSSSTKKINKTKKNYKNND